MMTDENHISGTVSTLTCLCRMIDFYTAEGCQSCLSR